MPTFSYHAIEGRTGRERSGTVEQPTLEAAIRALKVAGLFPTELKPVEDRHPAQARGTARRRPWRLGGGVGIRPLAIFTRQLAALLKARLPLMRALELLGRQERSTALRATIEHLAEQIRSGGTLSEALAQRPRVFDALYTNMVRAGEASGELAEVLDRLARFLEKRVKLEQRIRGAMTYPVVVMTVALAIVSGLMLFVIPRFENIFQSLLRGQSLPVLTQVVVGISRFVQQNVILTLLIGGAAGVGAMLLPRVPSARHGRDWLALRLPLFGDLGLKSACARLSRTWGTLLSSGVPILEALRITRDTIGNGLIAAALDRVHDAVQGGRGIAKPMELTNRFPPMLTGMVAVGEETGELPAMLNRVADIYEDEVDQAVGSLTTLLEPVMIVLMALVVGTIVIALFLPIVRIIQLLS
jgi:type IV pilus assembly protein PilC